MIPVGPLVDCQTESRLHLGGNSADGRGLAGIGAGQLGGVADQTRSSAPSGNWFLRLDDYSCSFFIPPEVNIGSGGGLGRLGSPDQSPFLAGAVLPEGPHCIFSLFFSAPLRDLRMPETTPGANHCRLTNAALPASPHWAQSPLKPYQYQLIEKNREC